ncbi:hypothetical protein JCM33374_g2844 [Metschnikowia sp. JCM 33374]|nr:hypothetical protein JCM33374_g2844 [Metschnikowia sp. JCM 33374]
MAIQEKFTPAAPPIDHDDDDLDDLLDEFDEQILSKPPGSQHADAQSETGTATARGNYSTTGDLLNDELKNNINDLIKDLDIEDPDAKTQFEQLVKQFEETHVDEPKTTQAPQKFDNVMQETMERLKKSGENIDEQLKQDTSAGNPEDTLLNLLAGLNNGVSGDESLDMTKLLTDMFEQLSSKEVLYEPIKDLNTKFPDYLEGAQGTIPAEEHVRFTKQYDITNEILAIFEAPGYDNDDSKHRERINDLLESMQELGNPPTALVGDENDFPGFGGSGGGDSGLGFDSKDLPKDFEKDLEEGCKQT